MSSMFIAAVALVAGAVLAVLVPGNHRRAWVAIAAQVVATLAVEVAVVPVLAGGPELRQVVDLAYPIGRLGLRVDPLSAFFLSWSLPMTLAGSVYALGYLAPYFGRERHVGLHWALLNLTSLAFLLIYTIENGLAFFFGWELAALAAWLLVIWDYPNQKVRFAGFNYLVSTHLSLLLLVAAFMLLHARTGSFELEAWGAYLSRPSSTRAVVFALLLGAFGLKSAFFPFHTWLPRAHSAAPAHVSALMSGVIHKAGLFGLLRLALLLDRPEPWMGWTLVAFSALSAVVGALYTTTQRDLKRLLGYSSTENVGICGVGFGVGLLGRAWDQPALAALGFGGGLLHVVNHALFKCLLFYAAGAVYRVTHTVDLERLGGLARAMPATTLLFLVGALAICAAPGLNGFPSELTIFAALLGAPAPTPLARGALVVVAALLAFVGAVSALSMTRCFGVAFLGSPRDPHVAAAGEAPVTTRLSMALHAAGCVALGLAPSLGLAWVAAPTRLFLPPGHDPLAPAQAVVDPAARLTLLLVAVAGGLAVARRLLVGAPATHVTWGCGYAAPTARMQYTGASFSDQFAGLFGWVLRFLRRDRLPARDDPFPRGSGLVQTHCVDSVERRMFKVMGDGQRTADRLAQAAPDDPRLSFALGLALLIAAAALILGSAP
jgi:hydrogenase-4 component B